MPRGRPKKAVAQVQEKSSVAQVIEEEAVKENVTKEINLRNITLPTLFWHGALPETDPFKIKRTSNAPTESVSNVTMEYFKYLDGMTTKSLWLAPPDPEDGPQWIGRCRWFQQLDVSTLHFPAFTDEISVQVGNSNDNRRPYPGQVSLLTPTQLEKILKEMDRFVIRINEGHVDIPRSEWHTIHPRNAKIIDLAHGNCPEGMSKEEHRDAILRGQAVVEQEYRRKYDIPLAEFVYLIPLDADPGSAPMDYFSLVPAFHSFFDNPPPALSELLKS